MAEHLQAVFYRDRDGNEPVDAFIDALPAKHQVAIDNQIHRINALCTERHPHLPFPHSSQVEGELRELRCHYGKSHYRIFYRRSGKLVVLLHMLEKRTAKIPPEDIKIAQERWEDFKARMDAQPRVPPRAAGRDAPPRRRKK